MGERVISGPTTATVIAAEVVDGRHRVRTRNGPLRAQRLHGPPGLARVALVGQTALLLGGDRVVLDIRVGPGASLELIEVAGTVAYDGHGRPARWTSTVTVAEGGRLVWAGGPFVLADGADVERSTTMDLAAGATAVVRETLVLGRFGECGGRLRSRTTVRRAARPILLEDLVLDPDERTAPGLLGDARVLDSVLRLGVPYPGDPLVADTVRYSLLEPVSSLTRFIGREADRSSFTAPRLRAAMLQG